MVAARPVPAALLDPASLCRRPAWCAKHGHTQRCPARVVLQLQADGWAVVAASHRWHLADQAGDPLLAIAARATVGRELQRLLATMPCFCTPERPELGRADWCAKHWLLRRVDKADLADQAAAARLLPPAPPEPEGEQTAWNL